jgi:hypothetical protein
LKCLEGHSDSTDVLLCLGALARWPIGSSESSTPCSWLGLSARVCRRCCESILCFDDSIDGTFLRGTEATHKMGHRFERVFYPLPMA